MQTLGFTLDRKSLKTALGHAARIVSKRNTIPVLSHVLFTVSRDLVRIVATDLDTLLTQELPADTSGNDSGALVLPLHVLKDAIGKLKGEHVRIEDIGGRASLACTATGARSIMPTLSPDEFPAMVRGDMLAEFWTPVEAFAGAIADALPSVSTEETRYYLQGVYVHPYCTNAPERTEEHRAAVARQDELRNRKADYGRRRARFSDLSPEEQEANPLQPWTEEDAAALQAVEAECEAFERERCKPDVLRFTATDGHRMALVSQPIPEGAETMPALIVPTLACKLLGKIIGKKPDRADMRIAANATKIELSYGRATILTKAIDGTFPDYTRVIPTQNEHRLTVPADAFAAAVDSVSAIATEKTRAVGLSLDNRGEPMILTCASPENGKAAAIVDEGAFDSDRPDHHSLVVGFNAAYMQQILGTFAGCTVQLQLSDPAAPMRIESPDKPELMIVLMPMRLSAEAVTTRADVESMHLNPWARLQRKAAAGDIAKAYAAADAPDLGTAGKAGIRKAIAVEFLQPAIAFLVEQGKPRAHARQLVKAELAYAAGDAEAGDKALRIIEAYESPPLGDGFAGLSTWGAGGTVAKAVEAYEAAKLPTPAVDTDGASIDPDLTCDGCGRHSFDCSAEPCADVIADRDEGPGDGDNGYGDERDPDPGPAPDLNPEPDAPAVEPETVAAEGSVSAGPVVDVVKVLTLTGQALFVARAEWENPVQRVLQRYNRDGTQFGERTVLRANIARLVPPRNRGDKPLPAAKVEGGLAERLQRLERIVAGIAEPAARPKRSAAHVRAIHGYLALRRQRRRIAELESCNATVSRSLLDMTSQWRAAERRAEKLDAAIECRDIALRDVELLRVRCDALEKLHVDSAALDAPADKPAIILPVTASSRRG